MPILAIRSSNGSLQSTGKRGFRDGTYRHTDTTHGHCKLETELAQWADSLKKLHVEQPCPVTPGLFFLFF